MIYNVMGYQFKMKLEPVVLLNTNEVIGYEALSAPIDKAIDIEQFFKTISLAASKACLARQLESYQKLSYQHPKIFHNKRLFVNVRRDLFNEKNFHSQFLPFCNEFPIAVEVDASSVALSEPATVNIRKLHAQGIHIWVDDYSGNESIDDPLWHGIKFDKLFFWHCYENLINNHLFSPLVNVGLSHNIVEGIETEAQREYAIGRGFQLGQGYLWQALSTI